MRKFLVVLKYELREYFASKGFMGTSIALALLGVLMLFLPRFVDLSGFTGVQVVGNGQEKVEDS